MVMTVWAVAMHAAPTLARDHFQCSIESQAAQAIIDLRDRGQPKSFVLAPLPPRETVFNSKRGTLQAKLAVQMHSIIEDVYADPDIKLGAYLAYRNASCIIRNAGKKVPMTFSEVALPIHGCQEKFGALPSAGLTQCVGEVFDYYQASDH